MNPAANKFNNITQNTQNTRMPCLYNQENVQKLFLCWVASDEFHWDDKTGIKRRGLDEDTAALPL